MVRELRHALMDLSIEFEDPVHLADGHKGWWCIILAWPPDVFALTSTLLGESGAYRLAVSPPRTEHWPPRKGWTEEVRGRAWEWSDWVAAGCNSEPPGFLVELGNRLLAVLEMPLLKIPDDWPLVCALLELHALADEASAGFGIPADPADEHETSRSDAWKEYRSDANDRLAKNDTLSKFPKELVRVLPKMRTAQSGITLRSLSGHLAFARFPEVDVKWTHDPAFAHSKASFNLLLLPVPLVIEPGDFKPVEGPLDNMDRQRFGFFRFEPRPLDFSYVERMLRTAASRPGGVDGVVLPESAVSEPELLELKATVERIFRYRGEKRIPFVMAGVRGERTNRAHFALCLGPDQWRDYRQAKHHRWCLDRSQINNYRIGAALHPSLRWWEDMEVQQRELQIIAANSWLAICPLICEDLARQDPVAQIIRAIGPTLVIALLLDGPQLKGRWPARYASVLADDPGSSVLTFTPLGMSERSVPPGEQPRRTVGLWKDAKTGVEELNLDPNATALLLTLCNEWIEEWMADGRSDGGSAGQLYLGHVEQLR